MECKIGMSVNNLLVIKKAETEIRYYEKLKRSKKIEKWVCECNCGNIVIVNANSLLYKGGKKTCGNCTEYTNKTFGCFTVLEECESVVYKSGNRRQYLCKCNKCGNLEKKTENALKTHKYKECSLCSKTNIGQRFGRLRVISECKPYIHKGIKYSKFLCLCDCGNYIEVRENGLKSGKTRSCSCLQKDIHFENSFKDLIGKKFGNLTVKGMAETEDKRNHTEYIWDCDCDCGNKSVKVKGSLLKTGRTKSCGCLSLLNESRMAIILKQVLRHEFPYTKWEHDLGFRTEKMGTSKYDIFVPELNLIIECQSEYHDCEEQRRIDVPKREFALSKGYNFMEIDHRDYRILDVLRFFVPSITKIPKYIKYDKKSNIFWDLAKAQLLLDEGYSHQKIASSLGNVSRSTIWRAIENGNLKQNTLQNKKTR